ncbi:hypothetical protein [Azospirillum agricola]|uniref:hypothetical protein n=1 Tax=Azospirillum agricola TaxID=1720247 RepID=UPI001177F3DC|nr:hypothetical protein [Azospirillum agricola]
MTQAAGSTGERPRYRAGGGRRPVVALAGALIAVFIVNSLVGLFAIDYARKADEAGHATQSSLIEALDTAREAQIAFKIQVQEWKNLLLRGSDPEESRRYLDRFAEQERRVGEALTRLRATAPALGLDHGAVEAAIRDHATLGERYRQALTRFDPTSPGGDAAAVDRAVRGIDRPLDSAIDAIAESTRAHAKARQGDLAAAAAERYTGTRVVAVASMLLGLLLIAVALGRAVGRRG